MIFHLYDDLGCDLIAADPEHLRPVYEGLQHWLLDYDRAQMISCLPGNKKTAL